MIKSILTILFCLFTSLAGATSYHIATEIWIGGDPTDATWGDMTAGKWDVYITYMNYNGR